MLEFVYDVINEKLDYKEMGWILKGDKIKKKFIDKISMIDI